VLGATVLALAGGVVSAAGPANAAAKRDLFPQVISLPNGWQPEGIAIGRGTSFYVGSLRDGAIYRGSVLTGEGSVLVEGTTGQVAVGIEVDKRNLLWVAGGATGAGRVYDAATGDLIASYQLTTDSTFVNDVVVTKDAAYFTDSVNQRLYVVPISRNGQPGAATTLPLTGELQYVAGFNVNGIEASPDGRTLLLVQSNLGLLFRADARTGVTEQVDLGGASLTNGDGLLRRGNTLYVVRNQRNEIAVIDLGRGYATGELSGTITDPNFQVPTTVAAFGPFLYAVNARFGTPPTPDTTYTVVRVWAR
jgi:sugar lactone lactonase YvrE